MKYRISDVASINESSISKSTYIGSVNYVDTSSVISGNFNGYRHYPSISEAPSRARRLVSKEDTVISTVRPNMKHVGFISSKSDCIYSTGFAVVSPKKDKIDPYYLYLFLSSNRVTEVLQSIGETSTSTYPSVKPSDIGNLVIDMPPLDEQHLIANRIRLIDEKKNQNSQINANLDELMSEIFERYVTETNVFTTDSLSNIANYKNGLAMQRFRPNGADKGLPVLKIKELNQGFTDSSSDRCSSKISNDVIVKTGDIIFSWSGTLIVKIWTGTTCGLNQHLFKVTSDKYPKWFIYKWTEYYLRQFQSIAAGKATTMGHIKRSDLKQAEVKIPYKSEIDRLDKLISPIFKRYVNNILEINSLKELKNELLSKLF